MIADEKPRRTIVGHGCQMDIHSRTLFERSEPREIVERRLDVSGEAALTFRFGLVSCGWTTSR